MTINVYLEARMPGWKLHSLYDPLIDFPPEGVVIQEDRRHNQMAAGGGVLRSVDARLSGIQPLNEVLDSVKPAAYYAWYRALKWSRASPRSDLIYSSQHLIFEHIPWVVDLEFASALTGYGKIRSYKRLLEKVLSSRFCKKIIPWTKAGEKSLRLSLDCRTFDDKIETVHLAVPSREFSKNGGNGKVRLLFVGTGNNFNVLRSFEMKGGRELLLAFRQLVRKYDNLELTVRSEVPESYRDTCSRLGIRVISGILPQANLFREFAHADIFVFPGHQTPGAVILDAMSFELPVVATDVWGTREMVTDGETGLLTSASAKGNYVDKNFIPQWGEPTFLRSIADVDHAMVDDIVKKLSLLIEDSDLRKRMGRNGRKETETGEFSIPHRNEKLGRIFSESLKR
jgi:glycosyltransferase involved in cell wall biosynthesis